MDRVRFVRNLLFSLVILAVVYSISRADIPMTHRVEEYIAYVLSTEFDYRSAFTGLEGAGLLGSLAALWDWRAGLSGEGSAPGTAREGVAAPATSGSSNLGSAGASSAASDAGGPGDAGAASGPR